MTNAEVIEIAEAFLAPQDRRELKYTLFSSDPKEHSPGRWDVLYEVSTPDGKLLEGPVIIIVNESLRTATFF